jgi:isoquinoline 1-oxidoreductase beta subunit
VICVVDCGPVVHPDNVVAQMEGSIIDGLSAALHGQVAIRAGSVATGNFNDYPLLRLKHSPAIEVHLIASQQPAPAASVNPACRAWRPPCATRIHAATGQRMPHAAGAGRNPWSDRRMLVFSGQQRDQEQECPCC